MRPVSHIVLGVAVCLFTAPVLTVVAQLPLAAVVGPRRPATTTAK